MKKSRLNWNKQSHLIELFVAGTTARSAGELAGVHRNTAALYFHKLRQLIYMHCDNAGLLEGEIEVDESYFGGRSKGGKRGRGAPGKTAVFGLLKREGKVFAAIIPDASSTALIPIIREKVRPDSIVYSGSLPSYNVLDVSEFKHYRINHSRQFADSYNHINGIENFWSQAKRHLRKFNGIPKEHFYLYLKECEWRFNNSSLLFQIKQLRQWARAYLG